MKAVLIIPTYNEKNNLPELLKKIFGFKINNFDVLVVDDNSPDGTGKVAENLKNSHFNLLVLHRDKKEGLGKAYVDAFKYVLSRDYELILQMDADFSHDPKYIFDFLTAIEDNDLVLGSRYIKGGGVENWNLTRKLISRFGNFYARSVLGLTVADLTSGFRCYRRKVLEGIDLDNLSSAGYCFTVEITYRVLQAGFKIKEIPIVFIERAKGKSKFNLCIIIESFINILSLRFRK